MFQCQELALPRPFDQPAAEKMKPDQSSKRSRRKAAFLNRVSKSQERRAAGSSADEEGDGLALLRSLPEDTRDRIWHTIHSTSDFESPPVPSHVLSSQAHAFNPQESTSLGRLWGRWATSMENFLCFDLRIPPHEWPRFIGRGLGAQTRSATWGRCKPSRFSRHGLASGWWGAVSKYLLLYLTCSQRNHGDAQQQAACAALHARAQTVPPSFDMDAEHEALWGFRLSDVRSITHLVLWGMYREATDRTHNLRAKAISEARRGTDDWVRQHAEKGNKRLHAWVRGDTPSSVEFQVDGNTTSDPSRILASKRQFWADFWAPGENVLNNHRALQSQRDAAEKQEPLPAITTTMLDTALRASRRNAGKGHDMLGPADILALPEQGRRHLCELLNDVEKAGTWPWLLLSTSIMLKPKPDNSDRPLGLLPMMVRVWEKIRQPPMQAWCRERAGPWDQAVERSPALRCALIRCAMAEAAAEFGMDAALSTVDLEKFYDTIRIDHLVDMALTLNAPARILLIDFMAYLARRAIQYLGAVSQWLIPGVSIVRGSRNSNNWARILLYDVLERAQARIPWVYPYQWVDDINLLAIGSQRLIEIHSPNATLELLTGLRNKGLRISSKSQIVASRPVLAKRLASLLELEGEKLKVATVGKDLGIDFSGTRTHRRFFHHKRACTAIQRIRRIRFIKKHKGPAIKMTTAGFLPSLAYGPSVLGVSAHEIKRMRREMCASALVHRAGRWPLNSGPGGRLGPRRMTSGDAFSELGPVYTRASGTPRATDAGDVHTAPSGASSQRSRTMAGRPRCLIAGPLLVAPCSTCPTLRSSPTPARFSLISRPLSGKTFGWRLTMGIVGLDWLEAAT